MKLKVYPILLMACLNTTIFSCSKKSITADLTITNVSLIDSKNGLRKNSTVHIKDSHIIKVDTTNTFTNTNKHAVINGSGKFLIPGLWDTHVHLTYNKELTPTMFDLFMLYGITSIRDTGGELHLVSTLKMKADKDPKNKPRVTITGPLLDGVPTVYNGANNSPKLVTGVSNLGEAKKQIHLLNNANVDAIKLYEMLSPEIFTALMHISDSLNIPATGHVPLSIDAIEASNAGMRSMEHLRNLELAFSKNWDSLLLERRSMLSKGKDKIGMKLRSNIHRSQRAHALANVDTRRKEEVFRTLKNNETWQVPTLTIMTVASLQFFGSDEWKATFKQLPKEVEQDWLERLGKFLKIPKREEMITYGDWMLKTTKELYDAEVKIMAGTDTPIFFLTPGYSLHEELALLVKSGLTPMQALDAATVQPAVYFKIQDKIGTIEEGKIADLILLNANPLKDIRNTTQIESVIKDGKLHNRKVLDNLKSKLEQQ